MNKILLSDNEIIKRQVKQLNEMFLIIRSQIANPVWVSIEVLIEGTIQEIVDTPLNDAILTSCIFLNKKY